MSEREMLQEAIDKLAAVGSPQQIAMHLRSHGIEITCRWPIRGKALCPIEEWITQEYGLRPGVGYLDAWTNTFPVSTVSIPDNMRQFIHMVDDGGFDDLS